MADRKVYDGKIVLVSPDEFCSNFDLTGDEIGEFLTSGTPSKQIYPVTNEPRSDTVTRNLSGLSICISDDKHKQKE